MRTDSRTLKKRFSNNNVFIINLALVPSVLPGPTINVSGVVVADPARFGNCKLQLSARDIPFFILNYSTLGDNKIIFPFNLFFMVKIVGDIGLGELVQRNKI